VNPKRPEHSPFPSANEDAESAKLHVECPQTRLPNYRLAFQDNDFLLRDELRPVRLQLELLKPELAQAENRIASTIVIFGSARTLSHEAASENLTEYREALKQDPGNMDLQRKLARAEHGLQNSRYYEEARRLARLISQKCEGRGEPLHHVVATGGGGGIMEAANRGAHEAGGKSIGLNIVLPFEQRPNPYITPELSFQFHYFAIRKMHFLMRAKALAVFPGGYGTMDELFETLTLVQTRKIKPIPIVLFGKGFWERLIDFPMMVAEGVISPEDVSLFHYVETAEEAFDVIQAQSRRK
jgi:uncharacterized protein (TIGR00730 family)